MAENGKGYIILDDGTKVPADNNGVPYPAHVAAEDPSLESSLETYIDDPSEDEDDTDADVDGFGYVSNPGSSDSASRFDATINALLKAGVRFDKATWCKISSGSIEFSIKTENL